MLTGGELSTATWLGEKGVKRPSVNCGGNTRRKLVGGGLEEAHRTDERSFLGIHLRLTIHWVQVISGKRGSRAWVLSSNTS